MESRIYLSVRYISTWIGTYRTCATVGTATVPVFSTGIQLVPMYQYGIVPPAF
jgi:hypothetical protein